MNLETTAAIVAADQNAGDWGGEPPMSPREAVEHVRNIMTLDEVVDYGDENTEAYRLVLASSDLPS
ncbi:MAG: hypothetical protein KDB25_01645 [Leucobacter sp.]|nr:hypothetical protein [Leucobacter sp.]